MPAQSKTVIKSYFEKGDRPTQAQFADLIDSYADIGDVPSLPIPVSAGGTGSTTAAAARTALGAAPTASPTFTGTTTAAALSVSGASTLSGTVTADNIQTSGSSGVAIKNSGGTTVLTVGPTNTTNATFAGALNVGGKLNTVATATGAAGLNLPHGTAPSSPTDGDFWSTTAGFYGRVNGATVGPFGGGGAMTLLDTKTASSSAQLDFTSVITSAYDYYEFHFRDILLGTNDLAMRYSTDNGSTFVSTSNYRRRTDFIDTSGTAAPTYSALGTPGTFIQLTASTASGASTKFINGILRLYNPRSTSASATTKTSDWFISETSLSFTRGYGTAVGPAFDAIAVNAIRIFADSGTITSGSIACYGVRNS